MSDTAGAARVAIGDIEAAVDAGQLDRAIALSKTAYEQGGREPLILNLIAYQLELEDRLEEALGVLEQALRLAPNDPFVINSIGVVYSKLARPQNALSAFEAALAIDPDFAPAHHGRGLALAELNDKDAARLAQLRAAELEPAYPDPPGALAALAADREDWAEARDYAAKALALEPDQPAGNMALAMTENAAGDYAAAEARMTRLLETTHLTKLHRSGALHHRAVAREGQGRAEEAMADYLESRRLLRPLQLGAMTVREFGLAACERFQRYFETADFTRWSPIPQTEEIGGEAGHVFLVGFARSGTTLLEQILASHGRIEALGEKPLLQPAILEFLYGDEGLERLAALDEAGAKPWRELYWKNVREHGVDPTGKVFVDKQPLHTMYLPIIVRMFPRAKILWARRDPRDVVVSCFRHRFNPNPLTAEFTDLERTAQVYAATMQLGELYRRNLKLDLHIHPHEALVEDLDAATQSICDFIGLPWDENMRNFVATAKEREIRTPSANQVRRGLYRDLAQWRKYGASIEVIHPVLKPWVEAFGYEAE